MNTPPEPVVVDSALLISFSFGLGSLSLLLAGVAVFLLLQSQAYFTKRKYRSNHISEDAELEASRT